LRIDNFLFNAIIKNQATDFGGIQKDHEQQKWPQDESSTKGTIVDNEIEEA